MNQRSPRDELSVEVRLQLALDAVLMGTWTFDLRSGSQTWDARQLELLGLEPDVQPSRDLFVSLVLPEDLHLIEVRPSDLAPGGRHQGRFRIRRPDGEIRWLAGYSITRCDPGGRAVQLVGVNWDITEQKQAEDRLRHSLQQLELALEAGRLGTWQYDLRTGAQTWDRRQYELLGLPPRSTASREAFLSLLVPEDLPRTAFTAEDLQPGRFHDTEFRIRRPDGAVRWLSARSFARHDSEGRPIERIGVNWDITDQKRAEGQLTEAERRLSLATEAAAIGIWDWNVETGEFFYSRRARDLYGFAPDEVITYEGLKALTHADDYASVEPALARALDPKTRSEQTYRYRITRADNGEERWLLAHGGAVFSGPGPEARAIRYTGTLQDITDTVGLETEVREQQARLQLAMGAAKLAVWELDVASSAVSGSPELNALFGFPPETHPSFEDLVGRYAPGERERIDAQTSVTFGRGETAVEQEIRIILPGGRSRWIGVRAQIILDAAGAPVRVIGVAMDVTERRTWEETLLITTRELQHRVKNSLTVVQSIALQTFRTSRTTEEGIEAFSGRLQALAAATDLLTRGNWSAVPIEELVEEVIRPYRVGGQQRFRLSGDPLSVDSRDAVNLGVALHELCTNAVKYGALSTAEGRVAIAWRLGDDTIELKWREAGGPPVEMPTRSGFGTRLLRSGLFDGASGSVDLSFPPEGVAAEIRIRRAG